MCKKIAQSIGKKPLGQAMTVLIGGVPAVKRRRLVRKIRTPDRLENEF